MLLLLLLLERGKTRGSQMRTDSLGYRRLWLLLLVVVGTDELKGRDGWNDMCYLRGCC